MLHDNMVRAHYGIGQTHGIGVSSGELPAMPVDHPDIGSVEPIDTIISSLFSQTIVAESEMRFHEASLRGLARKCNNIVGSSDANASKEDLPGGSTHFCR